MLFVVAVGALFVRVAVENANQLRQVSLRLHGVWFLAGAPLTFSGGLLLPLAWTRLLAAYGAELGPGRAVRIWWLAQTTRYIATGLAAVASRVVLAARDGVGRAAAGATTGVELVVMVAWSAVLAGAFLPPSLLPAPARMALAGAALGGLAALPWLLRLGGVAAARLWSLDPGALRIGPLYESLGLYAANAAVKSLGFVFLTAALVPVHIADTPLLLGAVNAAILAGLIGVTPAGIGVREGVLAALLRHRLGLGDAAAVAVALRVWDLAFEVAWLMLVAMLAREVPSRGHSQPARAAPRC